MKKSLLIALCLLSVSCLKAQTYTSGHITVVVTGSMHHDSTMCSSYENINYTITIDSSYAGEVLNIVDTALASLIATDTNSTGTYPWIITQAMPGSSYPDYNLVLIGGYAHFYIDPTKITCGADTVHIVNNDSLLVTNPCLYDTVSGRIYIDNNGNCVYDAGDDVLNTTEADVNENLSGTIGTWGWTETGGIPLGAYNLLVQKSYLVNYTVSLPPEYAFIFPFSPCYAGPSVYTTLPMGNIDFPLQCTTNVDVQCGAMSPGNVRPHRPFTIQPYVSNTGCTPEWGELTLVLDSRVTYDSALSTYPADTVRGDTLIWNYSNLNNLSSGGYWNSFFSDIYLVPDSATVAAGDTLCFTVYTGIPAMDIVPWNNYYSFCMPVVYSYDPNVKEVSPKGTGAQGYIPAGADTLTYSLHFQNTGTDVAENIVVIDTLDSHINASTLKILGASNAMSPTWLTPNVVQFNFSEINLPDSSANEAASHGEVQFSVILNNSLPYGTQIKNTGYIYFDANPPVVTNTTLNTIASPTKIDPVVTPVKFKVYPNPATDELNISATGMITNVVITNLVGQALYTEEYNTQQVQVNIAALPSGIYFVKINGTEVRKFIKE